MLSFRSVRGSEAEGGISEALPLKYQLNPCNTPETVITNIEEYAVCSVFSHRVHRAEKPTETAENYLKKNSVNSVGNFFSRSVFSHRVHRAEKPTETAENYLKKTL